MQAALHLLHREDDFASALASALAYAGPANYCPVLVGAIGGIRWGASAVPDKALQDRLLLPRVIEMAEILVGTWEHSRGR